LADPAFAQDAGQLIGGYSAEKKFGDNARGSKIAPIRRSA